MSKKLTPGNGNILIIDDEESLCNLMDITLSKEGYAVTTTCSPIEALKKIKAQSFDLIIADLMMPDMSGLELMSKAREFRSEQDFIVMTAFGTMDTAINAMKLGAADYITKPFDIDQVKLAIRRTIDRRKLEDENTHLKDELKRNFSFENIIGPSEGMRRVIELSQRVSQSDSTVLIRGESGVGKDLIARAIHNASPRARGPFVTINCAALPESLLESELFGHKKGSFTGAIKDKDGLFQVASGGTFFLDEIGNVSTGIQVKLLRAIEDQMITPLGETKPVKVDVRLVAATNADLEADVKSGKFRHDLYYRLNVIPIEIPSLRDRREDILPLASHFLNMYSERLNVPHKNLSPEALEALTSFDWPGNVRELQNSIERALLLSKNDIIGPEEFTDIQKSEERTSIVGEATPTDPTLDSIEKAYIFFVLNQTDGNKSQAAKILGIDASTLYRKLERYERDKTTQSRSK